jgi:hypothetical protein
VTSITDSEYDSNPALWARDFLHFSPDPVQEAVLSANPRLCLLNCSRQWGKSTITSIKALHNAIHHVGSLTLVVSPSERQSAEFIQKVRDLLPHLGIKPRGVPQNTASILLPNKSRIIGLPGNHSTTRGFSAVSLLLVDEASRVPDELYLALRPVLAVSAGSLWLISTPNGRRGFFFREWDSNNPQWTRVAVPATQCSRISPEFLEAERRALPELFFRQEYLCEFHDESGQLISRRIIDRCISDTIEPLPFELKPLTPTISQPYIAGTTLPRQPAPVRSAEWPDRFMRQAFYLGIDFGKKQEPTAIAIIEKSHWQTGEPNRWDYARTNEFRFAVRHLERFPLDTAYTEIATHIARLSRKFHPKEEVNLIADVTEVGSVAVEIIRNLQLRHQFFPVHITAGGEESITGSIYHVPKRDLIMKLLIQFEECNFKIASQLSLAPILSKELAGLGTKFSSGGNELLSIWRRDQHDDLVFAVALANWCARRDRWKDETRKPSP